MRLIGIAGPARSGKDTVAEILRADRWITLAFADPLRRMLAAGFGAEALQQDKEAPIPWVDRSYRELIQTLGTEWGRGLIREDLWIRLAERRIADMHQVSGGELDVAITDVRFENEAAWIRRSRGQVWHLRREHRPHVREHVSEAGVGVEPSDRIIMNNGTLEDLIQAVAHAQREIDLRATA